MFKRVISIARAARAQGLISKGSRAPPPKKNVDVDPPKKNVGVRVRVHVHVQEPKKKNVDVPQNWILWGVGMAGGVTMLGIGIGSRYYSQSKDSEEEEKKKKVTTVHTDAGSMYVNDERRYLIAAIVKDEQHRVICAATAILKNDIPSEEKIVQVTFDKLVDCKGRFDRSKSLSDRDELLKLINTFENALNDKEAAAICKRARESLRKGSEDGMTHLIGQLKARMRIKFLPNKYCVDITEAELYALKLGLDLVVSKNPKTLQKIGNEVKILTDNSNAIQKANFALLQANRKPKHAAKCLPPRKGHPNEYALVSAISTAIEKSRGVEFIFQHHDRLKNDAPDFLISFAKTINGNTTDIHYFGSQEEVVAIHPVFKKLTRYDELKFKSELSVEEQSELEELKEEIDRIRKLQNRFE